MSAQQFMEMLFGKLPEFFKDEAELRALWARRAHGRSCYKDFNSRSQRDQLRLEVTGSSWLAVLLRSNPPFPSSAMLS
jgi:hypothetical protein